MKDHHFRKWIPPQKTVEALPCHAAMRSPREPLPPHMLNLKPKLVERTSVPGDPVIRIVPSNLSDQHVPLRPDGQVSVAPTPLRDAPERPGEPVRSRLALHDPVPTKRAPPVMHEAEKLKPVPGEIEGQAATGS